MFSLHHLHACLLVKCRVRKKPEFVLEYCCESKDISCLVINNQYLNLLDFFLLKLIYNLIWLSFQDHVRNRCSYWRSCRYILVVLLYCSQNNLIAIIKSLKPFFLLEMVDLYSHFKFASNSFFTRESHFAFHCRSYAFYKKET